MVEKIIENLLSYGPLGIIVIIAIYAIYKLYNDMTGQHSKQLEKAYAREDKLMAFLDKKNESDAKIVNTLECINDKMECMDKRIEYIEKKLPHDV